MSHVPATVFTMINSTQIRFAPAITSMRDYLEPFLPWIERVIGCAYSDAVTFEFELPIGQLAIEDILNGVPLDGHNEVVAQLRMQIDRWELGGQTSTRIQLASSHKPAGFIVEREHAWHAEWRDSPIAVWLKAEDVAFVSVNVPYVSLQRGLSSDWKSWLIVNRTAVVSVLNKLECVAARPSKQVVVFGGSHLRFVPQHDWDSVVLDPALAKLVRDDFESFFKRERWFREHGIPFRRGYLFYGPPGNGKTTVIKIMASHPAVTPLTLDFFHECLNNDSLTEFFEIAAQNAPSLVILEDLDRVFVGGDKDGCEKPKITLQNFLNCLDGVGTQDGIIVVATANNPSTLDAAILKRPGRFDRVVGFHPPERNLVVHYLLNLSRGAFHPDSLSKVADHAAGLSFAQVRESYILAGQLALESGADIEIEHLDSGITEVRRQMSAVRVGIESAHAGFTICSDANHRH